MSGTPFPVDPVLTGIAIAYRNGRHIADRILPRLTPVLDKKLFKYNIFSFGEMITIPDTKVGRKSEPTTVEFGMTEQPAETVDYGLDSVIPNDDIKNAPPGYDPRAHSTQRLTDLVDLDREKRVSDIVFDPDTYGADNKELVSGTSKWTHADSKPIKQIEDAKTKMVMRPNVGVMGRGVWSVLRTNPSVLRALTASGSADGMAKLEAVRDLLELDEILLGETWLNSAKPGQPVQRVRLWGNHFSMFYRDGLATSQGETPTFGFTAQFGTRVAGAIDEPKIGLRGSVRVRSGESVKEVISGPDLGYLFEAVI